MSAANVVDSSGWLEYFTDSARAPLFAAAIEDAGNLFVPVISIYEVFKKVLRERGEDDALQVAGMMQGGQLIGLDLELALEAARHPLPLADSIIYATAMPTKPRSGHRTSTSKGFHMCAIFQDS